MTDRAMQDASSPAAGISIVTLGVTDLAASTAFYEKLGWHNTPASQPTITFLAGRNVVLGLYPRTALAEDAEVEETPAGFRGVTLAVNLESEQAVDAFFALATSTGAHPQKTPQKVFWGGYSGYFSDLDGHLWEIAHNPFFAFDDAGNLDLFAGVPS